ncbi:MBL fold metallo-hydrolase [Rubrolithibacter danxiaensis]|uniref:MBL fold metallo-hydrolase n=1 Tax=Rubrolithibacter danxiaensis TaxID=3390805 RepID=UPI003BF79169
MIKALGKNPSGTRLKRIIKSPNYKHGTFQNLLPTEVTLKNASFIRMMKDFINKPKLTVPGNSLPSVRSNLKDLHAEHPTIVWFGHSSYFIQFKNFKILVDPVFSGNASPFSFFGKAFKGADIYHADDFDEIDLLIITHDHYDHLDYKTIQELHEKVKSIIAPLGVGSHLEYWNVPNEKITELDWWESHLVNEQIRITATPSRHFSGRTFIRNKTLWASFVLDMLPYKIFIGGDSGYDTTFKTIGEEFGPFDIAILEAGQYGKDWPYIHMFPQQTVQASIDLQARYLLPVHWSKFSLSLHLWNEPIKRVFEEAEKRSMRLTTPMIGEFVVLDKIYPADTWWR